MTPGMKTHWTRPVRRRSWKVLLASALCATGLSGCWASLERMDSRRIEEDLPKLQEKVRQDAAAVRRQYAASLRGQMCGPSNLDDDAESERLKQVMQKTLILFLRAGYMDSISSLFAEPELRDSEIGASPLTEAARDSALATIFDVTPDRQPEAMAYPAGRNNTPRIVMTLGLIRALCAATDSSEALARIEALGQKPPPNGADSDWVGSAMTEMGNGLEAQFELHLSQQNFINGWFFVLGHELSHVILDPRSTAAVDEQNREIRADLVALFVVEMLTGKHSLEAIAQRRVSRTMHWSESDPVRIINLLSEDGHRTVFELVYIKAGFVERGGRHLPLEERLDLLDRAASRIGKKPAEN